MQSVSAPTTACSTTHDALHALLTLHPSVASRTVPSKSRPTRYHRVGASILAPCRVTGLPLNLISHQYQQCSHPRNPHFGAGPMMSAGRVKGARIMYALRVHPRAALRRSRAVPWPNRRGPRTCLVCQLVWKGVVCALRIAPCGSMARGYWLPPNSKYEAVNGPPVIPSVIGAITLVTLTEVPNRQEDLWTTYRRCKH